MAHAEGLPKAYCECLHVRRSANKASIHEALTALQDNVFSSASIASCESKLFSRASSWRFNSKHLLIEGLPCPCRLRPLAQAPMLPRASLRTRRELQEDLELELQEDLEVEFQRPRSTTSTTSTTTTTTTATTPSWRNRRDR